MEWAFSIGSIFSISIIAEIKANLPIGKVDPLLENVGLISAYPIIIFSLSLLATFVSWLLAIIGPALLGTGESIISEHRKLTGKDN